MLNPHLAQGTKDFDAARLVLEPLAHMGPDGRPIAALASTIPTIANGGVSSDLSTITWNLRRDVVWSDGTPFTSSDVVFTYRYLANPQTGATTSYVALGVSSVVALDTYTVRVVYSFPNPNIYQLFVGGTGLILQENQFRDFVGGAARSAPGNVRPIGTGPYRVVTFGPGTSVMYEVNERYRDPAKPFFRTVALIAGGDATSAARAVFVTAESDYSWNLQVTAEVLRPMIDAPDSKGVLVSATGANVERILLNRTNPSPLLGSRRAEPGEPHPYLSDIRTRKALAMAIDRSAIAAVYGLAAEPTCNILTGVPGFSTTNSLDVCRLDIATANRLLDEAGWPRGTDGIRQRGGVRMEMIFQTTVNALRQREQEIVRSSWAQLGVATELRAIDAAVFFGSDGDGTAAKFFADAEMFTNGPASPDPTDYLGGWTCAEIKTRSSGWAGNNYERWCNPTFDQLHAELKRETDPAKRASLIARMNDLLVADVVVIALAARKSPVAGASRFIRGVRPNPWDSDLWNVADWTRTA